jgi:hypothetical protein
MTTKVICAVEREITAMIDSGATTSVLGGVFGQYADDNPKTKAEQFNGEEVNLLVVKNRVFLKYGALKQAINVFVSLTSTYDLILGVDWLSKNVLSLDFLRRVMYLNMETLIDYEIKQKGAETFLTEFAQFFEDKKTGLPEHTLFTAF